MIEFFFRAWRASSGQFRDNLEQTGLQVFMEHSVLANRKLSIFKQLYKLLDKLHRAKQDRQLQRTLHDLWQPILWRNFNVANFEVRVNAVEMLGSAFPLENPDSDVAEKSMKHEQQYQFLTRLLLDDHHEVRVATINAILGKIAPVYWQIIPNEVLNR